MNPIQARTLIQLSVSGPNVGANASPVAGGGRGVPPAIVLAATPGPTPAAIMPEPAPDPDPTVAPDAGHTLEPAACDSYSC